LCALTAWPQVSLLRSLLERSPALARVRRLGRLEVPAGELLARRPELEVPILFGAKVSGRQSGLNIGVLDVQTRRATADSGELPGQNLLAARVSRNFFEPRWASSSRRTSAAC
jgi:hypothetical protein